MKVATWNINGLKVRQDHVLDWLEQNEPDVLCLQETKVTDQEFPEDGFIDLDYDVEYFGQPSYNGVAIVSRAPMNDVTRGFAGARNDDDKRAIAATIEGVRIVCVYVPNGQRVGTDKYAFKLDWLRALREYLDQGPGADTPLVLAGDFNIAPQPGDHFGAAPGDPEIFVSAEELAAFRALLDWGLIDSLHHLNPGPKQFTWWDYRSGAWDRNHGLRIDHLLVTPQVIARGQEVTIDRSVRGWDRASDHVPVILTLA